MSNIKIIENAEGHFQLQGKLDHNTVSKLWHQRKKLISDKEQLVIDLTSITHSDSSGLAFLTCLLSEVLKSNKLLVYVNIPEQLQKLITLSHLEDVLNYKQTL